MATIGIDPGVKYAGFCYGSEESPRAFVFNVDQDVNDSELIAIQHFDVLQDIVYRFSGTSSAINEIRLEMVYVKKDEASESLLIAKEISEFLNNRIADWIRGNDLPVRLYTHAGFETKEQRSLLGLQKTKNKKDTSVKAHINDAVALWSMSFNKINRFNVRQFKKEQEVHYCEFANTIVDEYVQAYKDHLIGKYQNIEYPYTVLEKTRSELLEKCCNTRSSKYSVLLAEDNLSLMYRYSLHLKKKYQQYVSNDSSEKLVSDIYCGRCDIYL